MAILEELLAPLSFQDFERDFLFRNPFAAPFQAKKLAPLLDWKLVEEIFHSGHADRWLAQNGKLDERARGPGILTFENARAGFGEGRTVLIRHAERAHTKMAEIATDFERYFHDPVDIQIYLTPAEQEGFGWHYDSEEVFVIQCHGEKEFFLRSNSVNPSPMHFKVPTNMHFEQESARTQIRCLLKAGDWLYIPSGYWHKAQAVTDSFHFSVGVMSATPLDYLDSLKKVLEKDVNWRRRLPARGQGMDLQKLREEYRRVLTELQQSLSTQIQDTTCIDDFLRETRRLPPELL